MWKITPRFEPTAIPVGADARRDCPAATKNRMLLGGTYVPQDISKFSDARVPQRMHVTLDQFGIVPGLGC
jgi:hypothetical protein